MAPWWWFPCKPKHVGAFFLILKCFNNSTFFNVVCINCKLKWWTYICFTKLFVRGPLEQQSGQRHEYRNKVDYMINRNSFTTLNQTHQGYITKINKFNSVLGKTFQFIVKTTQHTLCGQSWTWCVLSALLTGHNTLTTDLRSLAPSTAEGQRVQSS